MVTKMSENEVILLSSDDETANESITKISDTTEERSSQSTVNSDIDAIINKYKTSTYNKPNSKPLETISSSEDDDEDDIVAIRKKINSYTPVIKPPETFDFNIENNIYGVDMNEPKAKKTKTSDDKAQKKLEKEQEKARKQAERERIKAEAAKAKEEKQRLALAQKNIRPDECIKFITAQIDSDLMSMECSTDIPTTLQNANISYRVGSNVIPSTVTWSRKYQAQLSTKNGELDIDKCDNNCDEVLLIMLWDEFIKLVDEHEFISHVQMKKEILNKKVLLGIYGIENYFRFQKSKKQKLQPKDKVYADAPKVTRKDADMALIEIQLIFQISHRFLETPHDLSNMILQFSKSIAQIPYKLQKEQQIKELDWYVPGDKKASVKVDKMGNGLHRLWQQQLTQLNLVRFEVAEAISSEYPSPSTLIKAYEQCTQEEGEKLLQDIPIRRAAGPLTSARRIGPELSKKLYILFSSIDGNTVL